MLVALVGGQFLGPGDVAHAVFGHVQIEFPVAVGIGDAEQGLAFLHRAAFQPVLQVRGEDLAVDRTVHFEIGHLGPLTISAWACRLISFCSASANWPISRAWSSGFIGAAGAQFVC